VILSYPESRRRLQEPRLPNVYQSVDALNDSNDRSYLTHNVSPDGHQSVKDARSPIFHYGSNFETLNKSDILDQELNKSKLDNNESKMHNKGPILAEIQSRRQEGGTFGLLKNNIFTNMDSNLINSRAVINKNRDKNFNFQ